MQVLRLRALRFAQDDTFLGGEDDTLLGQEERRGNFFALRLRLTPFGWGRIGNAGTSIPEGTIGDRRAY